MRLESNSAIYAKKVDYNGCRDFSINFTGITNANVSVYILNVLINVICVYYAKHV